MGLQQLGEATYLLKGSPSTLFYKSQDKVYIVDPGHGKKRVKQLEKAVRELGGEPVAIVTHFHSDHLAVLYQGFEPRRVLAPRLDLPMIWNGRMRLHYTFGYPFNGDEEYLLFKAGSVPGAEELDESIVAPLEIVALPGHTPGQIGVLTPDGVLYAADSIFGSKVLDTYAVPYHADPCTARATLEEIRTIAPKLSFLVPSHGPVVSGQDIEAMIDANIKRIDDAWSTIRAILEEKGRATVGELAHELIRKYGSEGSETKPGLAILVETAVRGFLGCNGSLVEPVVTEHGVSWRLSRG